MKTVMITLFCIAYAYTSTNKLRLVEDEWFTSQEWIYPNIRSVCDRFSNNKLTYEEKSIIHMYARQYKLNVYLVLTIIEKETLLISNPPRVNVNYEYWKSICMGVGLHYYKRVNGKKVYRWGTFEQQIKHGCRVLRKWYDAYYPGITKEIKCDKGAEIIKPENAATYSLYMYTPHYKPSTKYGCVSGGYGILDKVIKRIEH